MGFFVLEPEEHFVAYASLADFLCNTDRYSRNAVYFLRLKGNFLYAAGLLFLSLILESVRTGIGASILGLSLLFLAYKKGRAVPA